MNEPHLIWRICAFLILKYANTFLYSTFNMGVGLTFVVKEDDRDKVLDFFKDSDLKLYELGKVVAGEDKIELSF